ncbi:hypothetical protein VR610_08530 [Aquirufa regiilacus]
MKIYAFASMFICTVFNGIAQGKHYKNQINRTLKDNNLIEKRVEIKERKPTNQTPKYQVNKPNIEWVDTFKTQTPSYKQHGGRPN